MYTFVYIMYTLHIHIVYSFVKQQPVQLSNVGRYCTVARWNEEHQFSVIRNRYGLFRSTLNHALVPYTGITLRYAMVTHQMFGIGQIKHNKMRLRCICYMRLAWKKWEKVHPIELKAFKWYLQCVSNKASFVKVTTKNDIYRLWYVYILYTHCIHVVNIMYTYL